MWGMRAAVASMACVGIAGVGERNRRPESAPRVSASAMTAARGAACSVEGTFATAGLGTRNCPFAGLWIGVDPRGGSRGVNGGGCSGLRGMENLDVKAMLFQVVGVSGAFATRVVNYCRQI